MKNNRFLITLFMILLITLTACSKIDSDDMLQQDDLDWLYESTSASIENFSSDDEGESIFISSEGTPPNNDDSFNNDTVVSTGDETTELSVGANLNILSAKNMPLATDTITYDGSKISYGAVIKNTCSYAADYTFFIIINGYMQPFILEGNNEEAYSANFLLEPNEERIIHFTFTPIIAPYDENALVSFMGLVVNKNPIINDLSMVFMNSQTINYNMYLTAQNSFCQINMNEDKNIIGNAIEELGLSPNGEASQVHLSDKKETSQTISFVRTEEFGSDNTITAYASRINDSTLRAFLWCEGEFLPAFNGEYYADIPDDKYALYEVPIDNSLINKSSNQRYNVLYIDMSYYQSITNDNYCNNCVEHSQTYMIQ